MVLDIFIISKLIELFEKIALFYTLPIGYTKLRRRLSVLYYYLFYF
jgi:hypothetical protein